MYEVNGMVWYAIQNDSSDAWDNGSYDFIEALTMLQRIGHGQIAVIENGNYCSEVISFEDAMEVL